MGVLQFQSATMFFSKTLWHNCILINASHYCGVILIDSLNFEHTEWMRSALELLNPLSPLNCLTISPALPFVLPHFQTMSENKVFFFRGKASLSNSIIFNKSLDIFTDHKTFVEYFSVSNRQKIMGR